MKPRTLAAVLSLALVACGSTGETGPSTTTTDTTTSATSTSTSTGTGGTGGSGGTTSSTGTSSMGTGGTGTGGTGGMGTGGMGTGGMSMVDAGTGGMAAFALTSMGFSEGAAIPAKYACSGANVSPDLQWTAGPTGTQSYAIVFTDKSNSLIHWVIWDIPAAVTSLPENVEKKANPAVPAGAKQVKSYNNSTVGYLGPCPPSEHTYEFALYALDVATLPNVTTASTRAAVNTEILAHDLGSTKLTGTFTP